MKRGQSFMVPEEHTRSKILVSAKRLGIPITSRKVDGEGFRIWKK